MKSVSFVVLRDFDVESMILNFHTDFRSPKVEDLAKNENSIFVFYDYKLKVQLRIKTISIINNQNLLTEEKWNKTKLFSRKCQLTNKAPSTPTNIPEDGIDINLQGKEPSKEESEKGYKNFTVVQNKIKEIDWLYLEASGHRRLKITFKENIKNFEWLIPQYKTKLSIILILFTQNARNNLECKFVLEISKLLSSLTSQ